MSPSPLTPAGGSTNSIIGPGGLIDTVFDISDDIASGDLLGAVFKTARGLKNFEDANLGPIAKDELRSLGRAATLS